MIGIRFYVAATVTLLVLAGVFVLATQPASTAESATVFIVEDSVATLKKNSGKNPGSAIKNLPFLSENQSDDLVQQKYAILFSALQLSPVTRGQLQIFLREREAIAGRSFYDASSNSAEIAENLRRRELDLAEMDERIAQLLTSEDAKKYALLKDSAYEQALLNGFYQVAGMESVPEQQKLGLLLNKLAQKQNMAELVAVANEQIANAAPATKRFLIEKTHEALITGQEDYLRLARAGLSDEQFELLQHYEQQLLEERWRDLLSSWQ